MARETPHVHADDVIEKALVSKKIKMAKENKSFLEMRLRELNLDIETLNEKVKEPNNSQMMNRMNRSMPNIHSSEEREELEERKKMEAANYTKKMKKLRQELEEQKKER
jgi:hypothetical protein